MIQQCCLRVVCVLHCKAQPNALCVQHAELAIGARDALFMHFLSACVGGQRLNHAPYPFLRLLVGGQ